MRTWSRRRKVLTVGGLVVVLYSLYVGWQVLAASSELRSAADDVRAVRREATVTDLLEPEAAARLDRAHDRFERADDRVSGWRLAPVRVVPIIGRQVRAVDRLASSGADATATAGDALGRLDALAHRSRAGGPARLALLDDLGAVAKDASGELDAIDPGGTSGLIAPLAEAVRDVRTQRDDAKRGADRLARASDGLADLFAGPTPYLLLGANNAEMRAGSGMFLSASEVRFDDGHVALGEVQPTADLVLPAGAVQVSGDLQENWGWLDPGRDLRQLGTSADFPQSATVAADAWEALGNEPVGGVVVIDVDGVRGLLRVVGPVEVDGIRYTADNVRGELLRKQYQRFDDDRAARRDQLGAVADAVFDRIESGHWDLPAMATELSDAVAGRHLLLWSSDRGLQRTWADLGADGHLRDDSLAVNLVNRSANKLDSWIDAAVDVTTTPAASADGTRTIEVRYRVRNRSTGQGARYVVGPNIDGIAAGDHRALVVVNLPAGATGVSVRGGRQFLEGGDGPTVVVGAEVTVERGRSATVVVRATLPRGVDAIEVEPSARIPRTRWTIDGRDLARDRRQRVPLQD